MKVEVEIPEGEYCYTHIKVRVNCMLLLDTEDGNGFYYVCKWIGDRKRLRVGKGCIYKPPDCPSKREDG